MSEDNGQMVVSVPPIADDQLVMIAQRVEQRVAAYNKIRQAALKATNWRHWSNQGGQPYLEIAGSKSIASLVGISWKIDEPVLEWLEDGHFSYTYKGEFSLGATTQECIGVRSSKDAFFSTAKGSTIPANEVDRGEVKKAALTNCLGNGVRGILGMNKLTWDDLKAAGIDAEKIGQVNFKSADPNQAPILPNYGGHKGKLVTDPTVSIEALKYYLDGCIKSIADPQWEKAKPKNERLRDAIQAELEKREKEQPAGEIMTAVDVTNQFLACQSMKELTETMNLAVANKASYSEDDWAGIQIIFDQRKAALTTKKK